MYIILLTKMTAVQNEVMLSYHTVRELVVKKVIFVRMLDIFVRMVVIFVRMNVSNYCILYNPYTTIYEHLHYTVSKCCGTLTTRYQ